MSFDTLTIGNQDYRVEIKNLKQANLRFYPKNPRVYSITYTAGTEPTQEEIQAIMCSMDHVKQLRASIESNGGLIDPLVVRDGDFTVLEGNSRLAAYRILCGVNPLKWGNVKCKILPADISDDAIFALLGQYHIVGKKDWEPFEQASYLYRRHTETRLPIIAIADELGLKRPTAKHMIDVVQFMMDHNDLDKRHWSYYDEYLKNKSIKKYRESGSDQLDSTIVAAVVGGQIAKAADIRNLGKIASLEDKPSKKLMQKVAAGQIDLDSAYKQVESSGKLDDAVKTLRNFRSKINEEGFESQIVQADKSQVKFELDKIIKQLQKYQKQL